MDFTREQANELQAVGFIAFEAGSAEVEGVYGDRMDVKVTLTGNGSYKVFVTLTAAQKVASGFKANAFFNDNDDQIEHAAQEAGAKVINVDDGIVYRFEDGSALCVSNDGWMVV